MRQKTKTKKTPVQHNHLQLRTLYPITGAQTQFFNNYERNTSQLLLGCPGTGKTLLAMYNALNEVQDFHTPYEKVIVVRSATPTKDLGALPGTLQEKTEVYEAPYRQIATDLYGRGDAYEILKKHKILDFMSTSVIRGLTLSNAIVIADEFQNMTAHEADSLITRIGKDSKILFCGDIMQRDLTKASEKNIEMFINVLESMPKYFTSTYFTEDDICRSGLVGDYIRKKIKQYPDGY